MPSLKSWSRENWEKVVITLPESTQRSSSGMELVAFSRAVNSHCFIVENDITKANLIKIGTGEAYDERR